MGGNAKRQRVEAGAGQWADRRRLYRLDHEGEWARPESGGQMAGLGGEVALAEGNIRGRAMGDQGIEGGPALGGIEPGDGVRIRRISREPVNRFGRHGDETAFLQDRGSLSDCGRVRSEHRGRHGSVAYHSISRQARQ